MAILTGEMTTTCKILRKQSSFQQKMLLTALQPIGLIAFLMTRRISLTVLTVAGIFIASTAMSPGRSLQFGTEFNSQAGLSAMLSSQEGALTLDSVYAFNFSDLGFGRLTFVRKTSNLNSHFEESTYSYEASFVQPQFRYQYDASSAGRFDVLGWSSPSSARLISDDSTGTELALAPEPSTWFGAALAIGAIALTQWKRLRSIVARRA